MNESNLDELLNQLNKNQIDFDFIKNLKFVLVFGGVENVIGTYSIFDKKFHELFKLLKETLFKLAISDYHQKQQQEEEQTIQLDDPTSCKNDDNAYTSKYNLKQCTVNVRKLSESDIEHLKNELKTTRSKYSRKRKGDI